MNKKIALPWVMLFVFATEMTSASDMEKADTESGARLFYERCVLCHGISGMGEGLLPLKIKDYPRTNLLSKQELTRDNIFTAIKYGSSKAEISDLMPPMLNELSDREINLLTDFVVYLREDSSAASAQLKSLSTKASPNKRTGEHLYSTRCVLCHGKEARGDGRMSKVITAPPPANLISSKADLNYIKNIVKHGGEAMGRSPQMPPWGDQFSDSEIESIGIYIMYLRDQEM